MPSWEIAFFFYIRDTVFGSFFCPATDPDLTILSLDRAKIWRRVLTFHVRPAGYQDATRLLTSPHNQWYNIIRHTYITLSPLPPFSQVLQRGRRRWRQQVSITGM